MNETCRDGIVRIIALAVAVVFAVQATADERKHVAQTDAAKRLDQKLEELTQEEIDNCKKKLAGLSAPGFTLRCDKLIPFGDLLGMVPVSQTASSFSDCVTRCRRVPKCVAFSFDAGASHGNHSCYLSGSFTRYQDATNWIAGVRRRN